MNPVCQSCGSVIPKNSKHADAQHAERKFCNQLCYNRSKKKPRPEKHCENCGKPFTPKRPEQKLCDKICARESRLLKNKQCPSCDKWFTPKRKIQTYCGLTCAHNGKDSWRRQFHNTYGEGCGDYQEAVDPADLDLEALANCDDQI